MPISTPSVPVPFESFEKICENKWGGKRKYRFPFSDHGKNENEIDENIKNNKREKSRVEAEVEAAAKRAKKKKLAISVDDGWEKVDEKLRLIKQEQEEERRKREEKLKAIAEFRKKYKYSWIELEDSFLRDRIVFLTDDITQESSESVLSIMRALEIEDEFKEMALFINSMGGQVQGGFAIYDLMQCISFDVKTVNLSICASTASFILAGGESTKRLAFAHSSVLLHQPFASFFRDAEMPNDMEDQVGAVAYYYHEVIMGYSTKTKRDPDRIIADLEEDYLMSAEEAKDHGIIDNLVTNIKDIITKSNAPVSKGKDGEGKPKKKRIPSLFGLSEID